MDSNNAIAEFLGKLKLMLDNRSSISLTSSDGEIWDAFFDFHLPTPYPKIEFILSTWKLPNSYIAFLQYCNGAILFKDVKYGQWGFLLYSVEQLIEKNELWHRLYPKMPPTYCVFAESFGDSDLLIIDTDSFSTLEGECNIIDGDVGCSLKEWSVIASSFIEWIDHLVEANGEKYWR